ncbi:MAG TPA: AAA family ATPase [Candidatus Limnocylindrales bacterium]|nr:AAA family ATPase [Candidatus Limnocylindrales bacterium]
MLIVVSGLPGSGKSALADGIGLARGVPVLSVDPIEAAILRAGIPRSFETGLAAYAVVETCADAFLGGDLDVVVDAVSSAEPARDMWRGLSGRHGSPMRVIVCSLDPAVALVRLSGRERGLALPEPTEDDLRARAGEWTPWPEPHLVLDSLQPPEVNLDRVLAWLGG